MIVEKNWNESLALAEGFTVNVIPARHFSGRGFKRNQSVWLSFVLQTPAFKIFIGGDSGYDSHFKKAGQKFGPFDLAILECGQYNEYWKYIHLLPEEVIEAEQDLKAKAVLPVHWAKFSLSLHAWDEPVKRVTAEGCKQGVKVITPMIGETVDLNNPDNKSKWWEAI